MGANMETAQTKRGCSALRAHFVALAAIALLGMPGGARALPVFSDFTPKPKPSPVTLPVNILNVRSVIRESAAVCDPVQGGILDAGRLNTLLQFNNIASVSAERAEQAGALVQFMAKTGVRVCFDQRLVNTPFSAALHLPLRVIALNPAPRSYFNSPGNQEMALFDAVEHLLGIDLLPQQNPRAQHILKNVNFVKLDPAKPNDSRRVIDPKLTMRFSAPVLNGTTAERVTAPLKPDGRLM